MIKIILKPIPKNDPNKAIRACPIPKNIPILNEFFIDGFNTCDPSTMATENVSKFKPRAIRIEINI